MSENKKELLWLIAVLVVLIFVLPALMLGPWSGYMSGMMGMMGYGWGFMFLIPLLFLALIALGAYYLITGSTRASRSVSSRSGRAFEILKERYAKGEITREQFLTMKRELEQ